MRRTPKVETGIGQVVVNGTMLYGRWECRYVWLEPDAGPPRREDQTWTVRVGLDEYEGLGVFPYQRVTLQVGTSEPRPCYLKRKDDYPPWTVLTFDLMQRR